MCGVCTRVLSRQPRRPLQGKPPQIPWQYARRSSIGLQDWSSASFQRLISPCATPKQWAYQLVVRQSGSDILTPVVVNAKTHQHAYLVLQRSPRQPTSRSVGQAQHPQADMAMLRPSGNAVYDTKGRWGDLTCVWRTVSMGGEMVDQCTRNQDVLDSPECTSRTAVVTELLTTK